VTQNAAGDQTVTLTASIISSSAIQTKSFNLIVPANSEIPPRPIGDYILNDNFEDGVFNPTMEAIFEGTGSVSEEEGKLVLERTATAGASTEFSYYFHPEKKVVEGIIGIEFTVERENNAQV